MFAFAQGKPKNINIIIETRIECCIAYSLKYINHKAVCQPCTVVLVEDKNTEKGPMCGPIPYAGTDDPEV